MTNVVLGKGAFKPGADQTAENDIFRFAEGSKKFQGQAKPFGFSSGDGIVPSSADPDASVLSKEFGPDQLGARVSEFGIGYWFRYFAHYPARLWSGKDKLWYHISTV